MSWSGTVTCRWCGAEGHNQRTCPEKRAWAEQRAANGDSYALSELDRKSKRTCGWCGRKGHNQRTCPVKKEAHTLIPQVAEAYNKMLNKAWSGIIDRGSLICDAWNIRHIALGGTRETKLGGTAGVSTWEEHFQKEDPRLDRWRSDFIQNIVGFSIVVRDKDNRERHIIPPRITFTKSGSDRVIRLGNNSTDVKTKTGVALPFKVNLTLGKGASKETMEGWLRCFELVEAELDNWTKEIGNV
jgi:hypothetical protein